VYRIYCAPRSAALCVQSRREKIGAIYVLSEVHIRSDARRDPDFLPSNSDGWTAARPEITRVFA